MSSANKLAVMMLLLAMLLATVGSSAPPQQDRLIIEILGDLRPIKMAVADVRETYRAGSKPTAPLAATFNDVLWKDLANSGLFTMVSKSLYPKELPGGPADLPAPKLELWKAPPVEAQMLAFGNLTTTGDRLSVEGYLFDPSNATQPMVLGKRYADQADDVAARVIAHRFADEIIAKLGGGIPGISSSRIYFVSNRTGSKEIWVSDYDGANQKALTHYNSITRDPAVTLDGSKLAYMSYVSGNPDIYAVALDTGRRLPFRSQKGLNATPAWSPDGNKVVFCASYPGDTELFMGDAGGGNLVRLTNSAGVDIEPAWNPKTGSQIAFVSGRGGLPQIYLMDSDGSNVRRLTAGTGEAVNPAWSPNGQVLAFAWTRGFAPGNYNIFVMDVASGRLVQLTHGEGRNEHPSWAPDGRHLVFESTRSGRTQIYTMLVDGSQVRALTSAGVNEAPVWGAR